MEIRWSHSIVHSERNGNFEWQIKNAAGGGSFYSII